MRASIRAVRLACWGMAEDTPKEYCTGLPHNATEPPDGSIEEVDFLHRVVPAVSRPQFRPVRHSAGGDQGIGDLDSVTPSVLPQVDSRLATRLDRYSTRLIC